MPDAVGQAGGHDVPTRPIPVGAKIAPKHRLSGSLANKMARGLWAMITTDKDFKNPGVGSSLNAGRVGHEGV